MKHSPKNTRILLVAVAVVLAATLAYVLINKNDSDSVIKNSTQSNTQQQSKTDAAVSLDSTKLTSDWKVEIADSQSANLTNLKNQCFISASSTSDTAELNSPDIDHYQKAKEGIESKGYQVATLKAANSLDLRTSNGKKNVSAPLIKVSNSESTMYQAYAYVSTDKQYTSVQLSCPTESDLAGAKTALDAITFSKI